MSKVISMSEFRKQLFKIFTMIKDTELVLRVYHRRKVYLFTITPTDEVVRTPYKRSPTNARNKIDPNSVRTKKCPICKDAMVNGICMNMQCSSNYQETEQAPMSEIRELVRVPMDEEFLDYDA
jgi:hypothetical protein